MKSSGNATAELYIMESQLKNWILCLVSFGPFRWGSGSLCLALGKPQKKLRAVHGTRPYQIFWERRKVKHATRDLGSQGKMSRELLKVEEHWKISSQIISWLQRIQMETIMIETIQQYCLVFPEQGTDMQAHGRSQFRESKFTTPAILDDFIPDHDRTKTDSRQKTLLTDRLSSMSRFVSHQGIWRFQFQAFFGTKEKLKLPVRKSVRRNCWNGFCSVHTE